MNATQLIAFLIPPRCCICGRECSAAERSCRRCSARLRSMPRPAERMLPGLLVSSGFAYRGAARDLITALKFSGRISLAGLAAQILAERIDLPAGTVLVPVPADPLRRRIRGYDTAASIATELASLAGLDCTVCLRRRPGPRQVGRSRAQRLEGPAGVSVRGRAPGSVVLVDDVVTTGSTLGRCAAALRGAGTTEVIGLTLASSARALKSPAGGVGLVDSIRPANRGGERADRRQGTQRRGDR